MPTVRFTHNIQRHVTARRAKSPARRCATCCDDYFDENQRPAATSSTSRAARASTWRCSSTGGRCAIATGCSDPVRRRRRHRRHSGTVRRLECHEHTMSRRDAQRICSRSSAAGSALGDHARQLPRRQLHAGDARPAKRRPAGGARSRALRRRRCIARATAARRGARLPRRRIRRSPRTTCRRRRPRKASRSDWSLKLVWALAPGGADQPGVVWCGTLPGGLFKSEDNGDSWELNRAALGRPAPRGMVWRRRRLPGHPLGLRRSARQPARARRRVVRRRLAHARRRRSRGRSAAAACAPSSCRPSAQFDPERAGPAPGGAVPRPIPTCSGSSITTASSVDRCGGVVERDRRTSSPRRSASRSPSIRTTPTPRGSSPASRTSSAMPATAGWWSTARATAARRSRRCRAACRRSTPTTWCSATRSTSTRPATRLAVRLDDRLAVVSENGGDSWETVVEPAAGVCRALREGL